MGLLDTDTPKKKRGLLDAFAFSQTSSGENGPSNPTNGGAGVTGGAKDSPEPDAYRTSQSDKGSSFFGRGWGDPKSTAVLRLAAGLMTPGSLGQGLSRGLSGYQDTLDAAARQGLAQQEVDQRGREFDQRGRVIDLQVQAQQQAMADQERQRQFLANLAPGTTNADLLFSATKAGAIPLSTYITATQKDDTPIRARPGDVFLKPGSLERLAAIPDKPAEDPAAVREYQLAQLQGFKGSFMEYQTALRKAGASRVDVRYGAPVAGVGPDGKPAFFQPDPHGGPPKLVQGFSPTPPAVAASTKEKLAENAVAQAKIDQAIGLVNARPDSLGLQNMVGDTAMQRLDPKGVELRAAVADIGSQKIHDRSGAAVTLSEAPRLKPFVPQVTDTPAAVQTKLKRLKQEYNAMQQALQSGASVSAAAAVAPPAASAGGWSIKKLP